MVFFVLYKSWLYEFHFNLWCMSIVIFDELIRHAIVRYNYCNRTCPPPPYPLPQLEYIYQAQELGCRMVGFSIICSRAQQWLKLEIVSVFLFIAIKPMFRSFKKRVFFYSLSQDISWIHILLNCLIFINTTGFNRCSCKSMKDFQD